MVMGDTSNYVKKVARNRLNIFRACHTHHTHLAHCGLKIMASAAVLDPTVLIVRGHRYDVTAYVDEHPGEGHNDLYLEDFDGKPCRILTTLHIWMSRLRHRSIDL